MAEEVTEFGYPQWAFRVGSVHASGAQSSESSYLGRTRTRHVDPRLHDPSRRLAGHETLHGGFVDHHVQRAPVGTTEGRRDRPPTVDLDAMGDGAALRRREGTRRCRSSRPTPRLRRRRTSRRGDDPGPRSANTLGAPRPPSGSVGNARMREPFVSLTTRVDPSGRRPMQFGTSSPLATMRTAPSSVDETDVSRQPGIVDLIHVDVGTPVGGDEQVVRGPGEVAEVECRHHVALCVDVMDVCVHEAGHHQRPIGKPAEPRRVRRPRPPR